MKMKRIIKKNLRLIGISAIICSWVTIASVWTGLSTISLIGYCFTGGLAGLTLLAQKI